MILTGKKIIKEVQKGKINISPFDKRRITTNSYDLSLGNTIIRYKQDIIDPKCQASYEEITIPEEGLLLNSGDFVLGKKGEEISRLYERKSNPLVAFIQDCCETTTDDEIPKASLYNYFGLYCRKHNLPSNNEIAFGRELLQEYPFIVQSRKQIEKERIMYWSGIKMQTQESNELDIYSMELRCAKK